jgi:hypothetical protein
MLLELLFYHAPAVVSTTFLVMLACMIAAMAWWLFRDSDQPKELGWRRRTDGRWG